ncbi:hypothetical protein [Streptomyces sp. NPDC058280]|uniref:hypothetical protein n=1 Tax=Streptomyces sp. NPDC058280 TaxID=3346419 RepID=UPI0036E13442
MANIRKPETMIVELNPEELELVRDGLRKILDFGGFDQWDAARDLLSDLEDV